MPRDQGGLFHRCEVRRQPHARRLAADEAVPSSSFRLNVRGSGSYRVEPWDGEASVVRTLFASAFVLRASLD
jgi:hypothetical protein